MGTGRFDARDVDEGEYWSFIDAMRQTPCRFGNRGAVGSVSTVCLPDWKPSAADDTIYKFDPNGNVVKSLGAPMFIWPHGMHFPIGRHVWATMRPAEDVRRNGRQIPA